MRHNIARYGFVDGSKWRKRLYGAVLFIITVVS
jgi:hypothetical protein